MSKKIVLAYSGGLDTSVIVHWLNEQGYEVIALCLDLGQKVEDLDEILEKGQKAGAAKVLVENVEEEFVRDYVFNSIHWNALYEGTYLLGTSLARPLIAKKQIEIAKEVGAKYVAHGATGKGNDQVRFELSAYALNPDIRIIAPWREWDLNSREKLISYAKSKNISVDVDKNDTPPYSMDANLLHISYEGKVLEDPWVEPPEDMWRWTVSPLEAPDKTEQIEIEFASGDPVSINGKKLNPAKLLETLNNLGAANGIGRIDIVENRFVGMKSRGVYETPGGTILLLSLIHISEPTRPY